MKAKEVFCELVEESIDGAYCLPTVDDQQSVQNAEPRNLRNRNKRHQVGSKVKERTGFKMKLRSHCVASDNSIHKNKHTANKLFKNEDDCNKISQTKTKGASSKDDSFEIKSDSICRKVPSKRETSIVVNFSPESTKKKVSRARKSKSNKYSEQAIISGDNNINKDKGHPRKSERPKRNSLSREFGGTPTKKKKVCTSSTDKSEVKNITPQSSAGAKEETKDTNLTETKSEITKKADLSRDTVQSAIRKVFLTLVDHLDPKTIIHKMLESEKYRHSNLRDIMDIINTSDRNRKLLDWISRRNITVYTHFKQCLLETRQNLLFKLLEIAEEDGDTSEITTHIIQNTIGLNSEGNKLYSELVAIADLRNRRIICFVFEYIGTTVCRALFMKKVNDLNPNDGEWTMDTFLNINRQNIEKIKHHSVKCGSDIIFPRAQLDSWGVSLFCLILINIFEITPSLRLCLEWVLDQREKIFEYNDQNQNRKFIDLKKYLMTIAAETEDDEFIKTVEEHFSQLEKGVLPNTDCEAITRSINHSKEEIIEEGRSNRDSIIDSCQQGQSEIKYIVRKGDKKIENKLDTILAEVQQLRNNACRNRGDQSVPATTMVKILVRGSESDVSICSQIVEAIKCRGTPSLLSDAVEEVRLKFQSKDWTIVNAEVGCIELYIQCSSVVSLLTLLKDYINGNLDAYLEPLEKAARQLDESTDLKFETVFYEESFYNILSSIDFRQFELSSNDVYQGIQEDRQTQTSGGNKAEVECIEVINVEGSELDNLKERTEENQDLLVDDPNTRLILLGLNFVHESEKVEKHLPGMSPMSDETYQCTSSNTKQSMEISYTSQRLAKKTMAYRTIVSSRERERDEYSDQSWADEELETTDRYGLKREATSDEIPLLFEEVRQTYDIQSEQALQVDLHPPPPEQETEAAFEEAFSRLQNENANNLKGCANCSKQVRVENVASFRKGQHLAMPGQKERIYNAVSRKLEHPYKHHAIVKNVKRTAGTRVEMELIHFNKENKSIEIFETVETYDLANDEIIIVQYTHPRYTTAEIVRRAESMLPQNAEEKSSFKSYNPFTRNCEHFATWCVVGGQSLQVGGLREKIGEGLRKIFGDGSNIAKGILRLLFISSHEIAGAMTKTFHVPEFVLGGASAIYLIYCIVMTVVHVKDYRKGKMCWTCCKRKLINLWATFGVFGVTSALTFLIFHFALPLMGPCGIPLMILLLLLSALLQWSVPKIRRALQSPFNVDKEKVNKLSDLKLGDVVSLRYYGLVHDMILTEVHEENSSSTAGRIRCVHYGLPTLFGTREIMEEYFYVNLEKTTLKRYDCRHLLCNPNEKVVRRAKKRVGETKWAMWSNRSDHFCFWAKVRQRPHGVCIEWDNGELEQSRSKNLSSLLIRKEEVNLMEDIQVGDVLQHETVGVLSGIRSLDSGYGRAFEIDQIIYDKGWIVRSKTFRVNLNKDKVYVMKFHPAHCHPMEKRAIRARGWIDRKGDWWTADGFIKECIMLNP